MAASGGEHLERRAAAVVGDAGRVGGTVGQRGAARVEATARGDLGGVGTSPRSTTGSIWSISGTTESRARV